MIPAQSSGKVLYRCPLCGNRFTGHETEACQGCPYLRNCKLVMCPRCGYEFPKTDKT